MIVAKAIISCLITYATWRKSYNWSSALEYAALTALLFHGENVSFLEIQTIKATISFTSFVLGLLWTRYQYGITPVYLPGSWKRSFERKLPSCHDWCAPPDFDELADGVGNHDSSHELTQNADEKPAKEKKADIKLQRYDFAAAASLSCHKFLMYSVLVDVKWVHWIVLVVYPSLQGWFLFLWKYLENAISVEELNSTFLGLSTFFDILQMLFTLMDIVFVDERLEDNNSTAAKMLKCRTIWVDTAKLVLLVITAVAWLSLAPIYVRYCAVYMYLFVCFAISVAVTWIVG